jgi:hypothetical protein
VSEGKAAYKTYKNIKQWTNDQIRQALANAPNYKTLIKPVADAQGIETMHLGTQDYYNFMFNLPTSPEAKETRKYLEDDYKKSRKKDWTIRGFAQ